MRGGKRENAGRKSLTEDKKKRGVKIYMEPQLIKKIEQLSFLSDSLSDKCCHLIEEGLDNLSKKKTIRIIDLFAGMGGIRLGMQLAAEKQGLLVECVLTSELKDYAIQVYKDFFNDEHIDGDITLINEKDIPDFDFLLAGFPCQPFSTAGKGLGFSDTRGTMFFEIERILKEKKPYGFILENVEGLVSHDKGNTLATIIHNLEKLDYMVSYKVLDSQYFGVPQSRKRIYIVGTRNSKISLDSFEEKKLVFKDIMEHGMPLVDSSFTSSLLKHYSPEELHGKSIKDKRGGKNNIHSWDLEIKGPTSSVQRKLLSELLKERRKKKWADIIGIPWMDGMPLTQEQIETFYFEEGLGEDLQYLTKMGYLTYEHPKTLHNGRRVQDVTKEKGYNIVAGKLSFEFSKIIDSNDVTPTLVAMDVNKMGVVDGKGIRRLTLREGLRLFGYPDNYSLDQIKERQAYDLLGNTVSVPVIEAISERLILSFNSQK